MSNKPIFFTSDLHLGHSNCIPLDGRPFRDLDHMHSELVRRFNNNVPSNGLTYFLGDVVTHSTEMSKRVIDSNERVTMSHCPLLGCFREDTSEMSRSVPGELWHGETRHMRYSFKDDGQFHLHGHIHSPNGGKSTKILGNQYDVGVVANNYTPVNITHIESWIDKVLKGRASESHISQEN